MPNVSGSLASGGHLPGLASGNGSGLGGPSNLGLLGPAASVPPGVLAELRSSAPKVQAAPPPSMRSDHWEMQTRIQAMTAGKLSAIEAVAGLEAPVQAGSVPQGSRLPQLDSFSTSGGAMPSQPPPADGTENQTAAQMYMLAQLAEESAQTAASAAACLPGAESDPNQVAALADAAQQAAARATWAANSLASCFPPPMPGQPLEDEWTASVRSVTVQSAEAAEQAALSCRMQANDLVARLQSLAKSKVPCKWFLLGQCRKTVCEFSHDIQDLQPRPLHKKRAEECLYFKKGQCTRGTACPFAHGPEELAEITRIVSDLKTEKRFVRR